MCKDRRIRDNLVADAKRGGWRVMELIERRDNVDEFVGLVKWFDQTAYLYDIDRKGNTSFCGEYDHVPFSTRTMHRRLELPSMTVCRVA